MKANPIAAIGAAAVGALFQTNPAIANASSPLTNRPAPADDGSATRRNIHAYFNHEFQKMRGAHVDVAGELYGCGSSVTDLADLLVWHGCPPLEHGKRLDQLIIGYHGPPGFAAVTRRRSEDGIVSVGFRDRHVARVDIRTPDIRVMCDCPEQSLCLHRMGALYVAASDGSGVGWGEAERIAQARDHAEHYRTVGTPLSLLGACEAGYLRLKEAKTLEICAKELAPTGSEFARPIAPVAPARAGSRGIADFMNRR